MPGSVIEQILERVRTTLLAANTAAGDRVHRHREEPLSAREVPAIKVRRIDSDHPRVGRELVEITMQWGVECHVRGEAWETLADALHLEAHAALFADAELNTQARYLHCAKTSCEADPADQTAGRLVAIYEARVTVTRADLGNPLN